MRRERLMNDRATLLRQLEAAALAYHRARTSYEPLWEARRGRYAFGTPPSDVAYDSALVALSESEKVLHAAAMALGKWDAEHGVDAKEAHGDADITADHQAVPA
jgi:hypothetical protein